MHNLVPVNKMKLQSVLSNNKHFVNNQQISKPELQEC